MFQRPVSILDFGSFAVTPTLTPFTRLTIQIYNGYFELPNLFGVNSVKILLTKKRTNTIHIYMVSIKNLPTKYR